MKFREEIHELKDAREYYEDKELGTDAEEQGIQLRTRDEETIRRSTEHIREEGQPDDG